MWSGYMGLGDLAQGQARLDYYEQAASTAPRGSLVVPLMGLAYAHRRADRLDRAVHYFEQGIEVDPANLDAHIALASLFLGAGQRELAKKHLDRAIHIDATSVEAMVDLGRILIEEGEWDEGRTWIEDAIREDPTDTYPLLMMAAIHADRKEPDEALRWRERAEAVNKTHRLESDETHDLKSEMKKLQLSSPSDREHQQSA